MSNGPAALKNKKMINYDFFRQIAHNLLFVNIWPNKVGFSLDCQISLNFIEKQVQAKNSLNEMSKRFNFI